jgi:hypothetical protein
VTSFAAISKPGEDLLWLMYAVGEANHQLFVQQGRSGGRIWARETEITGAVKKPGENVFLAGQGLAMRRSEAHPGRLIVPIAAGTETERRFHALLSDDGDSWKRVGPVFPEAWGEPELLEDGSGTLWMTSGVAPEKRTSGYRIWSRSEDGGETWSAPTECRLPDARQGRGALALGEDRDGKAVWYRVTAEGPVDKGLPEATNFTLFLSRDAGETWVRQRRFHFGRGADPSIVPLGPGRCAIGYQSHRDGGQAHQIRVVDLHGLGAR